MNRTFNVLHIYPCVQNRESEVECLDKALSLSRFPHGDKALSLSLKNRDRKQWCYHTTLCPTSGGPVLGWRLCSRRRPSQLVPDYACMDA
jgi:hypothetical protein